MDYELYHHGVKGMKWGVRRYRNADGSLTDKGRKRYLNVDGSLTRKGKKRLAEVGENSDEGKNIRRDSTLRKFEKGGWLKSYNKATDEFNAEIDSLNKRFGNKAGTDNPTYIKAVGKLWTDIYSKHLYNDFGPDPVNNGRDWLTKIVPMYDMYEDFT